MSKKIPHQYVVLANALNQLFNGAGAAATARGVMLSPHLGHAEAIVDRVERLRGAESVLNELAYVLRERLVP